MQGLYSSYGKPLLDSVLAVITLAVLLPLIFVVLVLYILTLEFPILFRQERIGIGGRIFAMYKFRTLKPDVSHPLAERRFWLGTILRTTSLDELPQLWNVLMGDMSMIGPRPMPIDYLPLFSADQRKRFQVKPGITGWAQVNGRHGISWEKKFELDNWYVDRQSFLLDLRILLKTIVLLLSFKKDVSLEEEPFRGS